MLTTMTRKKRIANEELAKYLVRTNTSQAAMARVFGVTRTAVHLWLAGIRRPSWRHALAIEAWTNGAIPARAWLREEQLEAFAALDRIEAAR